MAGDKYNNKSSNTRKKNGFNRPNKKFKVSKQTMDIIKFTGIVGTMFCLSAMDYFSTKREDVVSENTTVQYIDYKDFAQTYIENNPEIIEIDDLLDDYKQAYTIKEVKEIDQLYQGKYVEITGEINNVYLGSVDGNFITLKGSENGFNSIMTVECRFTDKEEIKEVKEYNKGDDITIQGYFVGSDVSSVIIKESLVK